MRQRGVCEVPVRESSRPQGRVARRRARPSPPRRAAPRHRAAPSAAPADRRRAPSSASFISAMKRLGSAGHHLAAALPAPASVLTASVARARVMPTYIRRRSSSSAPRALAPPRLVAGERQQPFVDAGEDHVRPLEALGGVQRRQRDDVLVVAALGQADDHRDRLRHLEHALRSVSSSPVAADRRRRSGARSSRRSRARWSSARPRARRLLAVVQVLLVADVLQPVEQEGLRAPRRRSSRARGPRAR